MINKTGCLLCGKDLTYLKASTKLKCVYCKRTFTADVHCAEGHYVCDACHSAEALAIIEQSALASTSKDPMEIAVMVMKHPNVVMHGPEHHFLVPAALLSAYYNVSGNAKEKKEKIAEARNRSEKVLGGFCGSHGTCGAAIGTGIFISLITESTAISKDEWSLSNMMTSRSLSSIANSGGPRCCKRDTFLAIREACEYLLTHFKTELEMTHRVQCEFSSMNKECLKYDCPFYVAPVEEFDI
jgi:hypothetical protein